MREQELILKVARIHEDAILPKYAHDGDSGFDLHSIEDVEIQPYGKAIIKTGIKVELPHRHEMQVRPKSGITTKTYLRVQLGTVDNPYKGEIGIIVDNISDEVIYIEKGQKVAQGVIVPVPKVNIVEITEDKLSESTRGDKGYGSTGLK